MEPVCRFSYWQIGSLNNIRLLYKFIVHKSPGRGAIHLYMHFCGRFEKTKLHARFIRLKLRNCLIKNQLKI
jgi:hypothetical protein